MMGNVLGQVVSRALTAIFTGGALVILLITAGALLLHGPRWGAVGIRENLAIGVACAAVWYSIGRTLAWVLRPFTDQQQ